jgi:hypothetical protein
MTLDEVERVVVLGYAAKKPSLSAGFGLEAGRLRIRNPKTQKLHASRLLHRAIAPKLVWLILLSGSWHDMGSVSSCGMVARNRPAGN